MKSYLFDINHPAQVHLLKNIINAFSDNGVKTFVTLKELPDALTLLNLYSINYLTLGKKSDSIIGKIINQLQYDYKLYRIVNKYNITLGVGSSITVDHVSRFSNMASLHLSDDDEDVVPLVKKYSYPYTNCILTPDCLDLPSYRNKQIKYAGYHELAYLHPNRFTPDKSVLSELGVGENDHFYILRFNQFKAHHDSGKSGLPLEKQRTLIRLLEDKGRIFITTEGLIRPELKKYQLKISPEKIHSVLYYARMFIGDSQTMTSEAAVLGTPSFKCNSFAGILSIPNELEKKYGLCYSYLPHKFDEFISHINSVLSDNNIKEKWMVKREKMLNDKIDTTAFLVWFIKEYPDSFQVMKNNSDYQYTFK